MNTLKFTILLFVVSIFANVSFAQNATISQEQYQVPILKGKKDNPFLRLKIIIVFHILIEKCSMKWRITGAVYAAILKK